MSRRFRAHDLDNVILTPHIAFFTNLAVKNMVDFALNDVLLILNGQSHHATVSA